MSLSCSNMRVTRRSFEMKDLESCIFPAFDVGENDREEFLNISARLSPAINGDLNHVQSILCAAWGVLLGCYTGLEELCFGLNQHDEDDSENSIGVKRVAQVQIPGGATVQDIIEAVNSGIHTLHTNNTDINTHTNTSFNTILSIRSLRSKTRTNEDESTETSKIINPKCPPSWCKIHMSVDSSTFDTVFSYASSFMTKEQAENVSSTFEKIVSEMISQPNRAISELDWFSERNLRQTLAWNNSQKSNVKKCIHEAISEQGALRPTAESVCAWDGSFTYSELLSLSDRLAQRLVSSGVGPEVFVPICFDKSKWTIVAMVAILKAGGIFVPLDPTHPVPRLQALVHKVGAKTLLCSRLHLGMLETVASERIPVDDHLFTDLPERSQYADSVSWSNGAYMIFTSGTTGEPKGALIQHGALLSSAFAHGPAMMMDSNTRSLQFAASTFDVSITEILSCLVLGGCVCVPSEEARLNAIEGAITQLRANWALLTPTFVKFINPDDVPCLKTLVTGGEAMTQDIIRSWSHINLINCYGPAETSVVSHVHRGMKLGKNPLNIGNQVGIHSWIVDRYNHNRLMPTGAVGELIIESHTLAREYYKEPDRTSEAFISDPEWASALPEETAPRRMYKTGDLVKYNHDGTFHIVGRKDTQIKFHGQRIELGEIEHHLNISPSIKHGMVVLPNKGFCQGRLLAVIQLCDALNQDLVPKGQELKLLDEQLEETASVRVAEAKQLLTERLPPYMIPSMWIAVEFIPRLQSGKLDRKQTAKWIDNMEEALYRRLNPVTATSFSEDMTFASKTEQEIHSIWSHVLNLNFEQLGLRQSFLSVGGDSISAMQVMSECKKRGLGLTVRNIIGCKSISELALHVRNIETPLFHKEILEQPFDLSPIQKLYFSRPNHSQGHYNQSFLLRTTRRILASDMRAAIESIIQRHSMLRARFDQDANGQWRQRITSEVASSYRLRTMKVSSQEEIDGALAASQTCLNKTEGPLLAADMIDLNGEEEFLFVVAHHLVIDLVSWRVILQELEELLLRPESASSVEPPLPFQTWCKLQQEHAQALSAEQVLPVQGIPDGNAEYWGMESTPNVYGEMEHDGFEMEPRLTSLLLSKCHESLRTEIPDILLAAMIFSFSQTFTDRPLPAVFAEGHGRESWDPSIDLSNIIGWFTTIYPVFAGSMTPINSLVDAVKLVKDGRRKVPDNGRPYFASRWLTEHGKEAFARHWPLEITFNYLGQYQQLEREGALFTPARGIAGEVRGAAAGADIGALTTCISFFEISAVILKGSLRFSFVFNQNMKHQPRIRQWVTSCQRNLSAMIEELCDIAPEPTLSDFPLLSLSYEGLQLLANEKLPEAGVTSVDLVEDAYPCSPMQSGLLVSTNKHEKSNAFYAAYTLHEVKSRSDQRIDAARLATAWKQVVEYHPILRTIFIESVSQHDSLYDQVVLKDTEAPVAYQETSTDEEAVDALSVPPVHQEDNTNVLHHFAICTSKSGKVFCRLDISHIIMDGTSMSILFRDLAMAYDGSLQSGEGPLYRNYIQYLESQIIQPGIDYWTSYLKGIEPCHFPVLDDGHTAEEKKLRYVRVKFDELTDLQSLCDSRGVTLVNAIYAAWAMTLRLYINSDEVCFGYLTSARDAPIEGIRDVVGPVINMVACRVNFSSSTTLGEVMATVQKDYLDSLAYRHVPLAEVQHALQLSNTALFNTALSYRKLPTAGPDQPDVSFEECRPTYDPDEYNVSVNIEAGDEDIAVDLTYWTDTLSDGQAEHVASTFTKALSNILHHSDQPVAELEHLGHHGVKTLCQWNENMPAAIENCIHDMVKQQAIHRPNAPAIASWDMNFTYAELDDASTRLAGHIASLDVGLESPVLVCFQKSAYTIVAMMAILKAGGTCVPLDPAHPDEALQLRAEDTGASIALISSGLEDRFSTLVERTVAVNYDLLENLTDAQIELPQANPRTACFIIYTSGSTGRPKGVILEHRGIATNARYTGARLGYKQDSRVLQFASYTFDNSLAEIFTTLICGGCVCVPSDQERLNDLAGVINRLQVTLADITPTVACFLSPQDVPTLRTLALGGEAVTVKCVDMWRDFVSLQCCYGPSECSVNSTYSGNIAEPGMATNIGTAVGSVTWVVDPNDHNTLLPVGCTGELLIDGPIVSRGYLNLPERTKQSFISPPQWLSRTLPDASSDPGRCLYKTGDLVRYNTDGTLMYLGRKDTQVKLNGQRIELGEIEHHIELSLPEGTQSAVELVVSAGKKALACFVCADFDGSVPVPTSSDNENILPMSEPFKARAKDLEVALSTKIPAYMIPTVWLPVSGMPLTSSGKLDRRTLRLQAQAVEAPLLVTYKLATKSGRAPSTDAEKQIAAMWASVLNIEPTSIGVEDNFFKLGGDSVGAMRLVTLARKSGVHLTVASIFQRPSLIDMLQSSLPMSITATAETTVVPFSLLSGISNLHSFRREMATHARVSVHAIQDIYPCTAVQEGLIALSNKEPGAYVAQLVYHLPDEIDISRFKEAWNLVVKEEATLRTRIVHTEDAGFVQVVTDDAIEWSTFTRLSGIQDSERRLPAHNGGRLINYAIVGDAGTSNTVYFVWNIHHALYDGWCLPIILNKVKECYQKLSTSGVDQTPGPSYASFIRYLTGIDSDQTDNFWRSRLSNLSAQQFPRLPSPEYQASASSLLISKTRLNRQPESEITSASRVRAAWALTVSAYSSSNDVVFWETVTGRDAPVQGIESMIGATLATVPTRTVFESSQTVTEFLQMIQADSASAMPHQHVGIHRIKRLSAEAAIACDAQNLIAIQSGPREASDTFWHEENNEMAGTNFYTYPIMLSSHIDNEQLETVVHFDERVISETQMKRMMDHFAYMVELMSSSKTSQQQLGDLAMLSPKDQETLVSWNGPPPTCIDKLVHEMISEQSALQVQDKLALCAWDCNVTYAELESLSDRLASVLVHSGISANSIVPFLMDKSAYVVISMLAILKSGAAFVPLDPAHPDARINGIIKDTESTVILCSPKHSERCRNFGLGVIPVSKALFDNTLPHEQTTTTLKNTDPAYVIFTSGTTGRPKGTIVSHSAFCTGAVAHGFAMGMGETSRVLQFASHTFDASIMEILTTLIHGGTVCIPSDEERLDNLVGAINRMDVNWTLLTPSVAQLIQPSLVPSLRTLVLGGEAMTPAHISMWTSTTIHLMNAYGPSETAVVATVNPDVTFASGPSNIGRAVGGLCWVTDMDNHDRLVPIGAVGELVVEGPILAQGYLKNAEQTEKSFITNPKWCDQLSGYAPSAQRRMYKTGDLVKLSEDGSILFQGRKDNQVKINGQRLELSEVEHHLGADVAVHYGLAATPLKGHCKKRLVAVLSLKSLAEIKRQEPDDDMQLVGKTASALYLPGIRERVAGNLPSYMVPTRWIVVDNLPLLPSGKLDRRRVVTWVEEMSEELYQDVLEGEETSISLNRDASDMENRLRSAWAKVLNLKAEKVPFNQSFLHLGGDSISAMQLMSVCRSAKIAITVPQIMQSKSIVELATHAIEVEDVAYSSETESASFESFELSPIQKVYFDFIGANSGQFNQSMLLETSRTLTSQELSTAIEVVIETHGMLRARFSETEGVWSQRVTDDVRGSYRLRYHSTIEASGLPPLVEESQKCLDIVEGPLFAADIFEIEEGGKQVVLFAAHHLVVDVISWNIILQDLEELLSSDTCSLPQPLSFKTWSSLQADRARNSPFDQVFHDVPVPSQDLSYWGMQGVSNAHKDAINLTLEIDTHHTLLLLGPCHKPLKTDVVDVLLAGLLSAFRQTFSGRLSVPTIFNEGHGREPWDASIDLSRTIGWFTTLCPVYLPESLPADVDILDIVRWVKDFRRKVPGKGRPYFAHSLLSQDGQKAAQDLPVEMTFNYLGQMQDMDNDDSIFKSVGGGLVNSINSQTDVGDDVPRLGLIEISASVVGGCLTFDFSFNRHMHHQDTLMAWIKACRPSIEQAVQKLCHVKAEPTMADFPMLPLVYRGVPQIQDTLSSVGVTSLDDVETAYPCSTVQQGILFTQMTNPKYYAYSITFEVKCTQMGDVVDIQRLADAWQAVVARQSILRTVFVDSLLQGGSTHQVVLRQHPADIVCLECSQDELADKLSAQSALGLPENQPPHRLRICKTPEDRVFCLLEMSHAIADGTSMPILFSDFARGYDGTLPFSTLSTYQEYIAYLREGQNPQAMEYWKTYLTGVEPCHFPSLTDNLETPRVLRTLDQTITHASELQKFCTEQGATLSNILQLAWALVLQAYTGLDDVCFGYLIAGRDVPVRDIDQAVGVFINMLVCRVRLDPSTSLGDITQRVQEDLWNGMQHKQVSLADIQHEMNTASAPLFNTAYSFQRRSVSKTMSTGSLSFDVSDAQDPSEYDITVNVEVWDSNAELQLCYWSDKLSDSQARNVASTFDKVLSSIASSNKSLAIRDLDILSEYSSQQLACWNYQEPEFLPQCVHDLFEKNAEEQSDETMAVDAWDMSLTYKELNTMASRLAQHLVSLGVKPEIYVPLCFEKSAWTVVAMIAVLKAGGAFVPLDPTHPPERVNYLVQSVDAKLILCSSSLTQKFENLKVQTLAVGSETMWELPNASADLLRGLASPSDPAYIIFTSGTTGLPKGTIIGHGPFSTGATAHAKAIKMTSTSRVLQFASHTFDASIMEILSTLLAGGCICIPSDQDRLNNLALAIEKFDVNWALLTPSVANVLKPGSVPSLKVLVTGGEAMSKDHISKWANEACLINAYGPSETSVIAATGTKVDEQGAVVNQDPSSIGHSVGSRSWIVDPRNHSRLMPIGSIGELVVEGPIIARGYLNNEEKTRDAFINQPGWRRDMTLEGEREDRMYKTGDLVSYNSDGSLKYIARKDTQIKLNGQRIELGEIEHHVKVNLDQDVQSVVDLVTPQSKTSSKALAVFFTVEESSSDEDVSQIDGMLLPMSASTTSLARALKAALSVALPSYMVPGIYIPVSRMPWTLAGKLDRSRLKSIVQHMTAQQLGAYKLVGGSQKRKPSTPTERQLQKVWQEVLDLDSGAISRDDSFFKLGGDSVGAMKLVATARRQGILLTVLNVFRHPKLSEMATICRQADDTNVGMVKSLSLLKDISSPALLLEELAGCCDITSSQIQDVYPCSSLQEGLITLSLRQPGAYVAKNVFQLPDGVDLDLFKLAWQRTVDRVDILRSRIVNAKSLKSYQVVLKAQPISWQTSNLLSKAVVSGETLPERNGGDLARFTIVTPVNTDKRYFVWTIHHALYDAWSMNSMMKLVTYFYQNDTAGVTLSPSVSFANFIKYLSDRDDQESDDFWRKRFQGASASHFPPDTSASTQGKESRVSIKHAIQYSKRNLGGDITISTVVRAAWALVLGSQVGSDDVVFGETLSGRDVAVENIGDIVGPTLTTVPTRVNIDRQVTVGHFLQNLQEQAAEAIPYQHAGLQGIKRLGDAIAIACDFKNLLVIQPAEESSDTDHIMQPVEDMLEQASFFTYPLVVECAVEAQNLVVTFHHDESTISTWQVKRIAHQLDTLIQQLINTSREASRKVAELGLCSPEDLQTIKEWNNFESKTVNDTVPELFLQAASRQPNKTAIDAWDGTLTYDAVRHHALQLARLLVRKGVRAETPVPCCMDKSLWTTVSMLAVLLAGGAIVPLDPLHPPARHVEMVRDCNAHLVLSSAQHQSRFATSVETTIVVDSELFNSALPRDEIDSDSLPSYNSRDAAFVIFTSGSTGKPKGVVIEHHSFCSSSKAFTKRMNMLPTSRIFHFSSYAFDIAIGETFGALTSGACLCVPSEEMRIGDLPGAITSLGATWAFLTPSVASIQDPSQFNMLETLVCGGEAMTPETVATWGDKITLMNGYGPAECTVFCVANDGVSVTKDSSHIGRAMEGGHTWVVDPRDHNYLVPLGCVGELLIDGPIVARGYLHNDDATAKSFVNNPEWATHFQTESQDPIRLYKTGDLVKYRPDGSLTFIGRKDHQVKLHGQRMELGEIEAHLESDHRICHALMDLPKSGIFKGRLVAIVSLHDLMPNESAVMSSEFVAISPDQMEAASSQISAVKEVLGDTLPPYMVPTVWLVVESIPLLVSGKLDRSRAKSWLTSMDSETYNAAVGVDSSQAVTEPETSTEKLLRHVWSSILDMEEETMPVNQSFISVGGDSITAMQVMTRCRDHAIKLSLQDIIKSKSIAELARVVERSAGHHISEPDREYDEKVNQAFELSPIQQLYFQNSLNKDEGDRFNQSQLLSLRENFNTSILEAAVQQLVQRHSMLRSRFKKSADGQWSQTISHDLDGSYSFQSHEIATESEMTSAIASSQNSISISGPLLAVDIFEKPDQSQFVSLIAHHLVVDVVSWINIIQDLEQFLTSPSAAIGKPFSFQGWNLAQVENAKSLESSGESLLPFNVRPADLAFWGMEGAHNTYGDMISKSFVESNPHITSLAFGGAHKPLRTEPLDLFISALLQSFGLTFRERELPTLFNEGHGRELWDPSIDLSQTVGWFTALSPVHISPNDTSNSLDFVTRVKDTRRSVPHNGRPYFAHRYLTESGRQMYHDHQPMELLVNYLGKTQQSKNNKALLQSFDYSKSEEEAGLISDVAPETNRLALFEISIAIGDNGIEFNFMCNKHMLHQDRIDEWVSRCQSILVDICKTLSEAASMPTLSDLTMMPINYTELSNVVNKSLPAAQIGSFDEVEDIYPCSPIQSGMLLSQLQDSGRYLFYTVLEVSAQGGLVDAQKLSEACSQVVDRHASMRTLFINSAYRGGSFDQVVLKPRACGPRVSLVKCKEIEVIARMNARSLEKTNKGSGPALPYQITICQTTRGDVYMKLELNHAITDGASTSLILQDISRAYTNKLPSTQPPSYKEYIKYISAQPLAASLSFWTSYLSGATPTSFPTINEDPKMERRLGMVQVNFHRFSRLHSLSAECGVTLANIILSAWALVLRSYTQSEDVCFGYLASGRDIDVEGIDEIVGPFINMLVFRFQFTPGMLLKSLFRDAQEDYLASLPHQHCSLARVNHALGRMKGFFNTAVSLQNSGSAGDSSPAELGFESIEAHDPSEYAVTLNVNTTRNDEGIVFRYWTNVLSESQAEDLAITMSELLDDFIDHSEEALSHLQLFQHSHSYITSKSNSPTANSVGTWSTRSDQHVHKGSPNTAANSSDGLGFSTTKKPASSAHLRELLANKLMSVWRDTLELGDSGVAYEDSFFELGGDSIVAMSMVGNAREMDLHLTVADIFKNPTFGELLQCLLEDLAQTYEPSSSDDETYFSKKNSGVGIEEDLYAPFSLLGETDPEQFVRVHICPAIGVSRASILDVLPTTDFQAQAIEGSQLESRWMLNHFYLDGNGPLNIPLLQESIANVVASYDVLRTVFIQHQDRFLQIILRQVNLDLDIRDVDDIEHFTSELELHHRSEALRLGDSLVRFCVARQNSSQRHRIFMRISHAQYDGVCFPAILESLKASYEGEPILPTPSYASYVRGALGKITTEHYSYWRGLLKGSNMTDVIPREHRSLQTVPTQVLKRVIPTRSLASQNITGATVVKAAWSIVLAKTTAQSDIVFGHLISGRNIDSVPGIESIVGPCLNMVPVRVRLQESWTVMQLLQYIQSQQVDNMPYESLGFREIIKKCSDWDDNRGACGFSTVVQHQSMPQTSKLSIGDNSYQIGALAAQEDAADFSVVTTPQDADTTEVCLIYAQDGAVDTPFAEQMMGSLCQAIEDFTKDPHALIQLS